jgi:CheY-like chemotaxis protein
MYDFDNFSMTIMVADDQEPNRELLSALLTAEGYHVISAKDGDEARSLIRSQEIDLALLDVVMPRLNGFTVCQISKSAPETRMIPIVLVTGLNRPDDRVDGAECGADDLLTQ